MKQQKGSVLIVTMIFLLIMTMIGTAGIEVTGLEERMAGNMRDRQMAFEAAEAALMDGEAYLDSLLIAPAFTTAGTGGFYLPKTDGTNHWDDWSALGSNVRTMRSEVASSKQGFGQLSAYATYIIEQVTDFDTDGSGEVGVTKDKGHYYRITARAQGQTSSSVVILQSVFKAGI